MLRNVISFQSIPPVQPPAVPAGYFVAATGSDSNDGTINSPWRTLPFAAAQASAGESIWVRGGLYSSQGTQTFSGISGQEGAPIHIRNYPGETPIFDGGATQFRLPGNTDWEISDASIGLYRSVSTGFGSYGGAAASIKLNGRWIRLVPYVSGAAGEAYIRATTEIPNATGYYMGPGVWKGGDGRIYIRLKPLNSGTLWNDSVNILRITWPNEDPRQNEIAVCNRDTRAFLFSSTACNHLTIEGLLFKNFGWHFCHILSASSGITFKNCRVLATGGNCFRLDNSGVSNVLLDGITYAPELPLWVSWVDIHSGATDSIAEGLEHAFLTIGSPADGVRATNFRVYGAWELSVLGGPSNDIELDHGFSEHWDDLTQQAEGTTNLRIHHILTHGAGMSYQGAAAAPVPLESVWCYRNIFDNRFKRMENKQGATIGDSDGVWRNNNVLPSHAGASNSTGIAPKIYNNHLIWGDRGNETGDPGIAPFNDTTEAPQEVLNNLICCLDDGNTGMGAAIRGAKVHTTAEIYDGNLYYQPGPTGGDGLLRLFENATTTKTFQSLQDFKNDAFFTETQSYYPPGWENSGIQADPQIPALSGGQFGMSENPADYIALQTLVSGGVNLSAKTWPGPPGSYRGAIPPGEDGSDIGPQTAGGGARDDGDAWVNGGPASGGGTFSPADLTGLAGWWHPLSGFTESGGAIDQWSDASDAGAHLTSSGTNRPVRVAGGLNGKDYLSFTAASAQRLLNAAAGAVASGTDVPVSMAIVYRRNGLPAGDATLLSVGNSGGLAHHTLLFRGTSASLATRRRDNAGATVTNNFGPGNDDGWHVVAFSFHGTTHDVTLDGIHGEQGQPMDVTAATMTRVCLGVLANNNFGSHWNGDIAEVILCAGTGADWNTETADEVVTYLRGKYGFI